MCAPTITGLDVGRVSARLALIVLLSLGLTRCDTLPDHGPPGTAEVVVMSQNLYLGGPIFRLIEDPNCAPTEANPLPLLQCADEIYDQIVASDFEARAESIADEIARTRPALVGLQEVSTYYVQTPADPTTPATEVTIDFLGLLLEALADRDLTYSAVSVNLNLDLELPASPDGQSFYDVRYQDADVVLALDHPKVATGATEEITFEASVPLIIGSTERDLERGYQTVEATVDGFSFTFVNTHLEIAEIAPIRNLQAAELAAAVSATDGPVVLVGDLNSSPDEAAPAPYPLLTALLTDVFDRPNLEAEPTCCQAADLENEESLLDKRIDFVLYRGADRVFGAETVLNDPDDRVTSDGRLLWPSDHAGVVALLVHNLRRNRP